MWRSAVARLVFHSRRRIPTVMAALSSSQMFGLCKNPHSAPQSHSKSQTKEWFIHEFSAFSFLRIAKYGGAEMGNDAPLDNEPHELSLLQSSPEVLNVEILNELIASFSKLGKGKAVFDAFTSLGVPKADACHVNVEVLCRRSFFDWARSVGQNLPDAKSLPTGLYKEKDSGQPAGNYAVMQLESPPAQFRDSQAFCYDKEEKSGSDVHETKIHFLDLPSIKFSSSCHNDHKCVHESVPSIDELFFEDALIIESPMHTDDIELHESARAIFENFIFLLRDIDNIQRSFHPIISCDLTPDSRRFIIDGFGLCRIEYDFSKFAFASGVENGFNIVWHPKRSYDSIHVTLSCDLPPNITIYGYDHLNSMVFAWFIFTHMDFFSSLQKFTWKGFPPNQSAPCILEPLPIKPEPPPRENNPGEQIPLLKFMILIRDENFCFKSLRRFSMHGCPFPSLYISCVD